MATKTQTQNENHNPCPVTERGKRRRRNNYPNGVPQSAVCWVEGGYHCQPRKEKNESKN